MTSGILPRSFALFADSGIEIGTKIFQAMARQSRDGLKSISGLGIKIFGIKRHKNGLVLIKVGFCIYAFMPNILRHKNLRIGIKMVSHVIQWAFLPLDYIQFQKA